MSHIDYCIELVKKHDYENYLSSLLLPSESRDAMFAVRAFNVEISQIVTVNVIAVDHLGMMLSVSSSQDAKEKIQDMTRDSRIGQMRYQFWRDSFDKIYKGNPPHTPIAFELAKAVHRYKLNRGWFNRIIDAREEELLLNAAMPSVRAVEERAERTHSSILYLTLESLGVKIVRADHACSHVGKAQGFITLIRAVPYHARRNKVYLPLDAMIKHHVSQEEVIRGCTEQKMKDLIFELASEAHKHLNTAVSFKQDIPKSAIIAFLPTVAMRAFLKSIQQVDFDVFDSRLQQRNSWLPFSLLRQKFNGTF